MAEARARTYKSRIEQLAGGSHTIMDAAHDETAPAAQGASHASVAGRSVTMTGNRIDSRDLFSSEREIIISHGEGDYRLRLTSQNKLILTK